MTSPFTGEFCEVRELQRGEKEGERERERREGGERDTSRHAGCFLRRNSSGMELIHFSSQVCCSVSASRISLLTAQRSGQMLLTSSSIAECIICLLFT